MPIAGDLWLLLSALGQTAIYAAVAGVIGSLFCLWVLRLKPARWLGNYLRISALLGLFAVGLHFLARLASLAGSLAEGLDPMIMSVLLDSVVGERSLALAIGFGFSLLGHLGVSASARSLRRGAVVLLLLACLVLLYSFGLSGHFSDAHWFQRLMLRLHVLAMALWLGSLLPLLYQVRLYQFGQANKADAGGNLLPSLRQDLSRFGRLASGIVGLLLVCGLWLTLQLVAPATLLQELPVPGSYGQMLGLKVLLVVGLLMLAALNKWKLVPGPRLAALRASVRAEVAVAVLILLATGVLAGLLSPGHAGMP